MKIQAFYINMARETERKAAIEESLREADFSPAWDWQRFEAIIPSDALMGSLRTPLTRGEIGHSLSQLECLHSGTISGESHLFIAEDDTLFSKRTETLVNTAIDSLKDVQWDIILTDIAIVSHTDMIDLFLMRRTMRMNDTQLLNINSRSHFGLPAYLVNHSSKQLVFNSFLPHFTKLPTDMILHKLCHEKVLRCFVTFPFATTISEAADATTIDERLNEPSPRLMSAYNEFRRLMWIDAVPEQVLQGLNNFEARPQSRYGPMEEAFFEILKRRIIA